MTSSNVFFFGLFVCWDVSMTSRFLLNKLTWKKL